MKLDPSFDISAARQTLDTQRRGSLANVLDVSSLGAVLEAARQIPRWTLVTRMGGKHLNLDAAAMDSLPAAQRAEFDARVAAETAAGFNYLYETFTIYDKWHAGVLRQEAPVLADLFAFLNSDAFLEPMRTILDAPSISFCDGQLTRYRAGHFLTTHDDAVDGKDRIAAYVLSLTEDWRDDWGGQLEFYGPDGQTETGFIPRLNALSLFKIPQPHAVTKVGGDITAHRLSITGWLRQGKDPGP